MIFSISTQVHLMTGPGTSVLRDIGRLYEEFHYALPNVAILLAAVPVSRLILGRWTALGIATAVAVSTLISATYFVGHANRILKVSAAEYWKTVVAPGVLPYLVGIPFIVPAAYAVAHTGRWLAAAWIAVMGLVYSLILVAVVDSFVWSSTERQWFHGMISARLARIFPIRNRIAESTNA